VARLIIPSTQFLSSESVFGIAEDGWIDAADLRAHLGQDANVEELIKQADKNNDGKIDQAEFCELLKGM
jgi:Ca2+-binding EF-hand superfamily protein